MIQKLSVAALVAVSIVAAPAAADVLVMADGRVFQDLTVQRDGSDFLVQFENGEVRVRGDLVHEAILLQDASYEPKDDEEREKMADGLVKFEGRWVFPDRRDRLLADRIEEQEERVAEMERTSLWRNRIKEQTKNFNFEVTVPQSVFEGLRDLMEVYFSEFSKTFKVKRPRELPRLDVKWFADYDQFLSTTGMPNGVQGFFRFVTPLELALYYDRLDLTSTEEVMYHEAGHYLQKLFDVDFKFPHWPGESLCEYFAASTYDPKKKRLTTGLIHEGRLIEVKADISRGTWVGLKDMITGCQNRNYRDYTWGWSFVHYLMSNKKYAKKFTKFFRALALGGDIKRERIQFTPKESLKTVMGDEMLEAFMKYMGLRNEEQLEELQKEWYEYIDKELVVTSSKGLAQAAFLNLRLGRPLKALGLYEEALDVGDLRAVDLHRYARLLRAEGKREDAIRIWNSAVAEAPMTADYRVSLGEAMLAEAGEDETKKEEATRMLKLALEIEPGDRQLTRRVERLLED